MCVENDELYECVENIFLGAAFSNYKDKFKTECDIYCKTRLSVVESLTNILEIIIKKRDKSSLFIKICSCGYFSLFTCYVIEIPKLMIKV
jgi:hypothetical protein